VVYTCPPTGRRNNVHLFMGRRPARPGPQGQHYPARCRLRRLPFV